MNSKKSSLNISHLKKSYVDKKILNDINLQIEEGEIVGLLGENGAGKTTLMNCITGIVPYLEGKILYYGKNLREHPHELRQFGILIHARFLDYLTAEENLKILGMYSGIGSGRLNREVASVLKIVGLYEKKDEYTTGFSFGQLQRLGVAQAILGEKKFLILDEPFVGLDSSGKEILEQIILKLSREKGCSVLLSSHDMDEIENVCDSIAIMKNGYVAYRDGFQKQDKIVVQVTIKGNELKEYIGRVKIDNKVEVTEEDKISINNDGKLGEVLNVLGRDGLIKSVDRVSVSVAQLYNNVIQEKI